MAVPKPADDHEPVVVNATEARQGLTGRPVLYVLVFALLLAVLAWISSEFWGQAIDRQTPSDARQATPAADASENDGRVNDDPPAGVKRETEPVLVNPQPTGNQ